MPASSSFFIAKSIKDRVASMGANNMDAYLITAELQDIENGANSLRVGTYNYAVKGTGYSLEVEVDYDAVRKVRTVEVTRLNP